MGLHEPMPEKKVKSLKDITPSVTDVPDLKCYRRGVDMERLRGVISGICTPEGFELDALGDFIDFDIRRTKSKFRFPPNPVFEYLGSNESDCFVLGLQKTIRDPKEGFNHCYYISYDKGSIPSNTDSAWASFQLKEGKLLVNCVQSETVMDFEKKRVEKEMRENEGELTEPQTGTLTNRLKELKAHNVPWAYPDRALLFGAVAVMIAQQMGLQEIKFVEDSMSKLATRTYEYTRDHTRHTGLKITHGMPEIF